MADEFNIPQVVTDYITNAGYTVPYDAMKNYIAEWRAWMMAKGSFYDYSTQDADRRLYKIHRRSVHPAKRVCREWASLLLNEKTTVQCEDQDCNEYLEDFYNRIGFWSRGQGLVEKAFGLGTGAWALWLDTGKGKMQVRRYDARMVIPLSWDDDGVTECAFVTQVNNKGKQFTQLQMHLMGLDGYVIKTVLFDKDGDEVQLEGMIGELPTKCETPTFAVVRPALDNDLVDFSPYGVSVFNTAIDAIQSVDLAYDAIFNEIDLGKMRVILPDIFFEVDHDSKGHKRAIPFGKEDALLWRKVASNEEKITEFAPSLRTESQVRAYRTALQTLGDNCGFGLSYFDIDDSGGIKTATEVSSDNSQLMRSIREHENLLGDAIVQISRAVLACSPLIGVSLPEPGDITVQFDDSIITDTAAEKAQDMAEVGVTMNAWEYRVKWYGEDEETAKANVPGAETRDMTEALEIEEAEL